MKNFSILLITLFFMFLFARNAEAKLLPQAGKISGKQASATKNSAGTGISVYPRLRPDKKALIVNFANLKNATSVSYFLTYKTGTQEEGAMGGINLTGASNQTQELLFGTCSKNVCRYHTGIHDARLEVSYTSITGKKYLKKYKIKI